MVAGSNPICSAVGCNPGQVVCTLVSLLPSSIIWHQPVDDDARWLGGKCVVAESNGFVIWINAVECVSL